MPQPMPAPTNDVRPGQGGASPAGQTASPCAPARASVSSATHGARWPARVGPVAKQTGLVRFRVTAQRPSGFPPRTQPGSLQGTGTAGGDKIPLVRVSSSDLLIEQPLSYRYHLAQTLY